MDLQIEVQFLKMELSEAFKMINILTDILSYPNPTEAALFFFKNKKDFEEWKRVHEPKED